MTDAVPEKPPEQHAPSLREQAAARGLPSAQRPTPAPEDPGPQLAHSRPATTGPAADHPVTAAEPLPARRSWGAAFMTLVLLVLACTGPDRWPWQHGLPGFVLMALIVLLGAYFLLVTERRRILRVLRASPWVEYPAEVELPPGSTNGATAMVRITGDDGSRWLYKTFPPRTDYQLGPRSVWCAGTPGATGIVVSLDQGGCVCAARSSSLRQPPGE